ncbi:hypothetical protein [Hyphomonas beringensis]|uniref:hypothetical protein n=1 Tax=Hyphomonas beringensis TaxID=1280946 RepID=UPI0012DF1483|nr:hypothetical protein [Hyphomonas beringensis]
MKIFFGLLYLLAFCIIFTIADVEAYFERSADLQDWTYLLSSIYWSARIVFVMGWITLLPAWLLACRSRLIRTRSLVLFLGLLSAFLPVWTDLFQPNVFSLIALIVAVALTVLIATILRVFDQKV